MGMQVHGGMGFIEETGAAQYNRDVRVTAIYEGTNGIQAMDLVARKLMDGGDAANALLDEIEAQAEAARADLPDLAEPVWQASETLREALDWMVAQDDLNQRFAGAAPFLKAFARVLGGHYLALPQRFGTRTRRWSRAAKLARFYMHTRSRRSTAGLLAQAATAGGRCRSTRWSAEAAERLRWTGLRGTSPALIHGRNRPKSW